MVVGDVLERRSRNGGQVLGAEPEVPESAPLQGEADAVGRGGSSWHLLPVGGAQREECVEICPGDLGRKPKEPLPFGVREHRRWHDPPGPGSPYLKGRPCRPRGSSTAMRRFTAALVTLEVLAHVGLEQPEPTGHEHGTWPWRSVKKDRFSHHRRIPRLLREPSPCFVPPPLFAAIRAVLRPKLDRRLDYFRPSPATASSM